MTEFLRSAKDQKTASKLGEIAKIDRINDLISERINSAADAGKTWVLFDTFNMEGVDIFVKRLKIIQDLGYKIECGRVNHSIMNTGLLEAVDGWIYYRGGGEFNGYCVPSIKISWE